MTPDPGSAKLVIIINFVWGCICLGSRDVQVGHPDVEQVQREREALLHGPDGRVRGDPRHSVQGSVRPVLRLYSGLANHKKSPCFGLEFKYRIE
jgi:hypothetical protein